MRAPALVPAIALLAGAVWGIAVGVPWFAGVGVGCLLCAVAALTRVRRGFVVGAVAAAAWCGGASLADRARTDALDSVLRRVLSQDVGGFLLESIGPGASHDPISTRMRLVADAAPAGSFVSLRAEVTSLSRGGQWVPASGGLALSVGGSAASHSASWTAGRIVEAPVTYRRPSTYFNDGVPDLERDLALNGIALFGSTKSPLLLTVVTPGSWIEEAAAAVRRYVRLRVAVRIGARSPLSAGIVTAVLIGDRTGLPDDVRERLQKAGTYHVIAISGGNIAILAALVLGVATACGCSRRLAAALTVLILIGYAQIAAGGPSVRRATAMALVYLIARALDHRTAPTQSLAVATFAIVCLHPLDVRDAGFLLTIGATGTLLLAAHVLKPLRMPRSATRWIRDAAMASLAAEIALLPIGAATFSRITVAGLLLNFAAIPLMTVVQIAGIVAVVAPDVTGIGHAAGWLAHAAAVMLVESARLVDVWPWLTWRVPDPHLGATLSYYALLFGVIVARDRRRVALCAAAAWCVVAIWIVAGLKAGSDVHSGSPDSHMRLTMMDVGQGESMMLELPGRSTMLVDAGGEAFGSGGFDIGGRVLAPALWARGIRSLEQLLITHGDPDHLGGAPRVLEDFAPRTVLEGIPVSRHERLAVFHAAAKNAGSEQKSMRAGMQWTAGDARLRVLHPPDPDWERPVVRNDDSVVIEVVLGGVAFLLAGDISAEVERLIAPQLTPARIRILKVAHHGSRTSSSAELLDAWRPQYALISAGRGNRFGHPAPEVLRRLNAIGARVYRTDRDGQITITTDGNTVRIRTFTGGDL